MLSADNILWSIYIGIAFLILSIIAMAFMGEKVGLFVIGFPVVYILAWIALFIAGNYTILYYGLEYVLWCLVIGLFISNVIGVPSWLKPAVKTEYLHQDRARHLRQWDSFWGDHHGRCLRHCSSSPCGGRRLVFLFLALQETGIDDEFAAILSSGVSICGVSAAIATSGAVKGDPKKLSYVTSIVLICAVPMLVLFPLIAKERRHV